MAAIDKILAAKKKLPYPYYVTEVYRDLSTIHAIALTAFRAKNKTDLKKRIDCVTEILTRTIIELEGCRAAQLGSEFPPPTKLAAAGSATSKKSGMTKGPDKLAKPDACGGRCREPTPFCCNGMCSAEPCLGIPK